MTNRKPQWKESLFDYDKLNKITDRNIIAQNVADIIGFDRKSEMMKNVANNLGEEGRKNRALTRVKNMGEGAYTEINHRRAKTLGKDGRKKVANKTAKSKLENMTNLSNLILSNLPDIFTKEMFANVEKELNIAKTLWNWMARKKFFKLLKNGNQFIGPTTYIKS
jgi:hypothetical protein